MRNEQTGRGVDEGGLYGCPPSFNRHMNEMSICSFIHISLPDVKRRPRESDLVKSVAEEEKNEKNRHHRPVA